MTNEQPGVDDTTPVQLSDPRALRALSHPVRIRILTALRQYGAQNVKQVAAVVEEPANSVSYHLAQLARHGLVAPATPPRGATRREKWWQITSTSGFALTQDLGEDADPAGQAAVRSWLVQTAVDNVDQLLAAEHEAESADLLLGNADVGAWLTPAQARDVQEQLNQVLAIMASLHDRQDKDGTLREGPHDQSHYYRLSTMLFPADPGKTSTTSLGSLHVTN